MPFWEDPDTSDHDLGHSFRRDGGGGYAVGLTSWECVWVPFFLSFAFFCRLIILFLLLIGHIFKSRFDARLRIRLGVSTVLLLLDRVRVRVKPR